MVRCILLSDTRGECNLKASINLPRFDLTLGCNIEPDTEKKRIDVVA